VPSGALTLGGAWQTGNLHASASMLCVGVSIRLYAVRQGVEAAQVPRPASTTRSRAHHAGHDLVLAVLPLAALCSLLEEESAGNTRHQSSWGGSAFTLFGVWLRALFPLSMTYGISHFHAVRWGVETAQALLPCLDSWALQVCSDLERSRARCNSSWFWLMGRARSHARRGIKVPSPLSMLQLPLQGCQEFEAHPGRVGVHDSFCTYLFPAAGAAGAVSFQLKGTRGDEYLSFSLAPCAGASLCAVGVMFPPALSVRVLEMGLRSSTQKGKRRSC